MLRNYENNNDFYNAKESIENTFKEISSSVTWYFENKYFFTREMLTKDIVKSKDSLHSYWKNKMDDLFLEMNDIVEKYKNIKDLYRSKNEIYRKDEIPCCCCGGGC